MIEYQVGKKINLRITRRYLQSSLHSKTGRVHFHPASDRQSSYYVKFHIEKEGFFAKFGNDVLTGENQKIGECTVIIEQVTDSVEKMLDPNMPSPSGGFQYDHVSCKLVEYDPNAAPGFEDYEYAFTDSE